MPEVPSSIPRELIAGDTWQWTRDLSEFPAGTWTATIYFEQQDSVFNVVGIASGTSHSFSISAATTTGYRPGRYGWRLRVTDGTTRTTVESGMVEVKVDPAAPGKYDTRSWARQTLDNLQAFLRDNALTATASFSIRDRSYARWQIKELDEWRKRLEQEVRAEEQGANAGRGRDIKVRFGRA